MVLHALLHTTGRNGPDRCIKVDFLPFHLPDFTRPLKDMWREPQCMNRSRLTDIGIDRTEEGAQCLWIDDRRMVLRLWRGECAYERPRRSLQCCRIKMADSR